MSEAFERYQQLEKGLILVRWINRGLESTEEDVILEEMDSVWFRLSAEEQAQLSAEPVRSFVRQGHPITRTIVDEDVWSYGELPPRRERVA
jgi:hypothetical protein